MAQHIANMARKRSQNGGLGKGPNIGFLAFGAQHGATEYQHSLKTLAQWKPDSGARCYFYQEH